MSAITSMVRNPFLRRALAALMALSAVTWSPVVEANARLGRLFGERFARYALTETAEGRAFTREVIGRQARTPADLDELLTRLRTREMRPLADDLADRLDRVRAGVESVEGARSLSASQRSAIQGLSRDELAFELIGQGRLRFVGRPDGRTYAGARDRFVRAEGSSEFTGPAAARLVRRYRNPLRNAFPASLSAADLETRMAGFLARYPDRTRVVENVRFDLPGRSGVSDARTVVVLSTKDLTTDQMARLVDDYLNAVGRGTVSFPLSEGAEHLYSRVGKRVFDFMGGPPGAAEYRLPSHWDGRRLEPIVRLNLEEELRLRKYLENAANRPERTVGEFDYNGTRPGTTRGRLDDNRPTCGGEHNCTSWMATAPIGVDGSSLKSLVGARPGWEIHTNPGWWQSYLVSSPAARERVPYVFYWTDESLPQALRKVRSGARLRWRFGVH